MTSVWADPVQFTVPSLTKTNGAVTLGDSLALNGSAGIITFTLPVVAAGATTSSVIKNSSVVSTSIVNAQIIGFSGTYATNGSPIVNIGSISDGSFVIHVLNTHLLNAFVLGHTIKVSYMIL